ncbi:DUF4142 domain-containing protein [Streptomyces violens]|uniref:DUF4142 domain-containing protein n=1 Tax=Streptomyces violens TaxID=66377 RepID=UPI0006898ED3|nr:DUF4142 domain-containing protein [Streptomyces violens]
MIAVRGVAATAVLVMAVTGTVTTTTSATASGSGSGSAASSRPTDSAFLRAAHQGNLAEIEAGRDAGRNATKRCVKRIGGLLVHDHRRMDRGITSLAAKLRVRLPGSPSAEQRRALAEVQAKKGTRAYDRAWLRMESAAHVKTLALISHELRTGRNSEVKAAARKARPMVAMHLALVRSGFCR